MSSDKNIDDPDLCCKQSYAMLSTEVESLVATFSLVAVEQEVMTVAVASRRIAFIQNLEEEIAPF